MFNCQRNDGHHFFTWTAAGNVIETAQGLPSGTIWPEVCSNFVTVKASGDTFMSVMWSNYNIASHPNPYADLNPPSPTHHGYDLFKWDGTSWTIVTADYASLGWWVAVPNGLATDGHSLYLPTYETTNNGTARIRIWTPDLSAGNPPNVAITGSGSATGSPTATMDSTTGRAFVPLTTSVFADNSVTIQWAARGPAAVVFDDPNALSPTAWFTMPGNYVLNMRATDTVTHLSAGSSVIVHILPANSGTPPAILTQPVNQLGVISGTGSATFTVQASGTGPLRYQWKRNGIDIAGNNTAQSSALTISTKFVDDGSVYHCVVSNPWGSVVSNAATLGTPPVILANPVSQIVSSGGYAAFSVSASGTQRFQWQWLRNGTPITTGDPKTHNSGTFATNVPGTYSVVVSNMFGSVTSGTATLTVGTPPSKFFLVLNAVASPSTSGGDINAEDGTYVSASYPINTNIPIGAEVTPLNGSYFQFDKWTVTTGGSVATVNAPQTTAKATTAGSTVVYTTNYKDSSSLPLYFLNVVNGIGCGLGRASVFQPTSPVTMNIAAAPAPTGYTFHHWTGSGVASTTSASTTVTLTNAGAETAVVAHYVVAPYTLWKQQVFGTDATNPAVAGDLADPDHDGLTNLVEYAINSQPLDVASGKSSLVVDTETAAGSKYLRLTVPKNSAATDATYTVQVSSDLRTWDAASTVVESNTSTTLSVRDSVAFTSATRRFIRLQVTLQ